MSQQLLVFATQRPFHGQTSQDAQTRKCNHENERENIPGRILASEKVWTPNITHLTEKVDDSRGTSSLFGRLTHCGRSPRIDQRVCRKATRDIDKRREVLTSGLRETLMMNPTIAVPMDALM